MYFHLLVVVPCTKMYVASTHRCATVAEPTRDASKQRRAPAAAEAPKRWCPVGPKPIMTCQNRTDNDLPSFPAAIKGCYDNVLQIGVRSGSIVNIVSESVADDFGLDIVIVVDDFGYEDYLDPDQSFPVPQASIIGLTCFTLVHNGIALLFDGFVVCDGIMNSMHADIMAGAPFMEHNDISIRPRKHQIMFGDEYVFSYVDGTCMSESENANTQATEAVHVCPDKPDHETMCDHSEKKCEHVDHLAILPVMASRVNESESECRESTDINQSTSRVGSSPEHDFQREDDSDMSNIAFIGEPQENESEGEDSHSDLINTCQIDCFDYRGKSDHDLVTLLADRSSTVSPTLCDVDGRRTTPFTEHSLCPVTELSSCPPCSERNVSLPVTKVTDHSPGVFISEIEFNATASVSRHSHAIPTTEPSSVTLTTEPSPESDHASMTISVPRSVILSGVVVDVPQVTCTFHGQSCTVPKVVPYVAESSDKTTLRSPVPSTTLPPVSTPMGRPHPDEGALPLRHQYTTYMYAALPYRPICRSSDAHSPDEMRSHLHNHWAIGQAVSHVMQHDPKLDDKHKPARLHSRPSLPPIWNDQPSADDPWSACVVCRAALPYPAAGHVPIYVFYDDSPQATLADDDVPCLRPSSSDVGRQTSPAWKSPPWTNGRLPPASSMERGPSPRPHDGAMSAFAHVMATKRVSPAPVRGIAHPFGVPWTLPPAPPDVGMTAVPHGHNPPESPCTPG